MIFLFLLINSCPHVLQDVYALGGDIKSIAKTELEWMTVQEVLDQTFDLPRPKPFLIQKLKIEHAKKMEKFRVFLKEQGK